ncbi:MAG: DNA repair protein RecO [Balneolaceae bacterium]
MIIHSQAIILRVIDYQESSKIITALTDSHGKIALIAKGAKRPKSKLAGVLEAGNILDVIFYYKSSRSVQTLTEASISYSSATFRKDFARASVLYASLELIAQLVHENELNEAVFEFSKNFIGWLGEVEKVDLSVFAYVQFRLAEINGIGLRINAADHQREMYLNIASGNISDKAEDDLSFKLTPKQSNFAVAALSGKSRSIFNTGLENGELKQLVHHIDVYFKYHIDGYQERKSDAIFDQML